MYKSHFGYQNGMKSEKNYRKKNEKKIHGNWVKKEIKEEITTYIETNEID